MTWRVAEMWVRAGLDPRIVLAVDRVPDQVVEAAFAVVDEAVAAERDRQVRGGLRQQLRQAF